MSGPTTPEGKARSSRNALKHGLRSRDIVLPGEDPEEWFAFRDDYLAALDPVGLAEEALAYRAAELYWRLLRVAEAERKAVAAREETPDQYMPVFPRPDGRFPDAFRNAAEAPDMLPEGLPAPAALRPLVRYEAHLSKQFHLALRSLQDLQDRRRGAATTRVTRVEVHGYPNQLKEGAAGSRPAPPPPDQRFVASGPSGGRAAPPELPNELAARMVESFAEEARGVAPVSESDYDEYLEEELADIDLAIPGEFMAPLRDFARRMAIESYRSREK